MPRAPFHLDSIKSILAANGEMRQSDLAGAADLKASTLHAAVAPGLRSGEILKRTGEGRSVFYRLAEGVDVTPACAAASEPEQKDFNAAAWADGDVDLYGLIELDDGGHRLSPAMVSKLKRVITWMPGQ
jgi:hypothetical protein